jgi:hypothetical protein
MTNPSFVNRVETLPPIGASDHDIVYSEINLALPQNKQQAHKVRFFFLYNLFFLLINFFSWLFTQGNLDLLPMLFVGICLWIVSWTFKS